MLNILLNRYYITNANRSVLSAETQAKVQGLLNQPYLGLPTASGASAAQRGKEQHEGRRQELQCLWKRQLAREEGQDTSTDNFCTKH